MQCNLIAPHSPAGLEELDLAENRLRCVPSELGAHLGWGGAPALTSLDLSGNRGIWLDPTAFHGLAALRRLDLSRCNLAGLPGGSYLSGAL